MRRLIIALAVCVAMVTPVYGQAVKDVTTAVKDKAVGTAKEKAAEKASAYIDDATITADVKMKMAETPSLKGAEISVKTADGVVTLTGVVKNKQVKGVATKVAKGVKGVKSVDNQLTIEKPAQKAPPKAAAKPDGAKK